VLSGEPGIGKSTLWQSAVELGRSRGFATLCARASEAEAQLTFAGLADLLEPVDRDVLAELPAGRRHALEVAIGRAESDAAAPEPLAIAAGLLDALGLLSAREHVLVAIDDLPWLDRASAAALLFAARRLADDSVRYIVSRRSGPPSELETVLEPAGVARLELGPLSFGAINRVLTDRLVHSLPRRVTRQIFETSRGNPLFALELGRAVVEHGLPEIGAALPVPAMLEELFGARIAALPPDVRRTLLALALSGGLGGAELAAVVDPLAIDDARAADVLRFEGARVRASHPLLAAAAAQSSTARERRDVHLALAEAVGDPVLRARHLALAASAPDAPLAAELSAAAARAAQLGAVQDAVELARHALRLTPGRDGESDERLLELARYLMNAGDVPPATELLSERIESLRPGPARAAAHLLLVEASGPSVEEEHSSRAIAESADDPGLHAEALGRRAILLALSRVRRMVEAEQVAREALDAAQAASPDAERRALVALAWVRVLRGCAIEDLAERSERLVPTTSSLYENSLDRPAGARRAFRGEVAEARETFRRLLATADERGEFPSSIVFTLQLCEVELRAGHSSAAARALEEWHEWTLLEPWTDVVTKRLQALLAALRGEAGRASTLATEILEASEASERGWDRLDALRAAGLAALLERQSERAITSLEAVWAHTLREGVDEPGAFPVAGDLVEALAESGRLEAANEVIERLGRLASDQQHPWGLATTKRSRAVVRLVQGQDDAAVAELEEAGADYGALGLDFESARALLFLGRAQRRFRKRAAAREALEHARSTFAELGCPGWAQVAGDELARISGRRKASEGALTPTERRIAELVATGLSNKEVAAELFVTVTTVESHLSKVYAKLGIRSRTQLARHVGAS
jgi:DNA-binding NarL/FixJ family response regulator